jgi:hypothetical protein
VATSTADGRRDVFWYGPGAAADRLWYGGAGGRFTTAPAAVHGSYRPLVADFGGDGPDDVLWWAPGAAGDVLWFGRGSRRFTSRWTTVDLDLPAGGRAAVGDAGRELQPVRGSWPTPWAR